MTVEERINYWKGIIDKYRESGLSVAEFCKEHNISTGRFYHWRRRFSNEHCKEDKGFFEVITCSSSANKNPIYIRLTNGIVIEVERGFDPVTLRGVIETVVRIRQCSQ